MLDGHNPVSNVFGYKEGDIFGGTNNYGFHCAPWTEENAFTTESVSLRIQNSQNNDISTNIVGKCVYAFKKTVMPTAQKLEDAASLDLTIKH